jgi:hypothetical protein
MPNIVAKARDLARLALDGHRKEAFDVVRARIYLNSPAIGLRRDLSKPFEIPKADLQIEVRPLRQDDDLAFLRSSGQESRFRHVQLRMLQADIPTCYVAVAPNGDICYMQWLIAASENERIQAHFGRHFPLLKADEALAEGSYTVPEYRRRGIMSCAGVQICNMAKLFGARWVLSFVSQNNIPSLKGCARAGLEPYLLREETWRMFHRRTKFLAYKDPACAVERSADSAGYAQA